MFQVENLSFQFFYIGGLVLQLRVRRANSSLSFCDSIQGRQIRLLRKFHAFPDHLAHEMGMVQAGLFSGVLDIVDFLGGWEVYC